MVTGGREGILAFLLGSGSERRQTAPLMAATPVASEEICSRASQPGDIILATASRRRLIPWPGRVWLHRFGLAQACFYCSAKLCLFPHPVVTYGFCSGWDRPLLQSGDSRQVVSLAAGKPLLRSAGLVERPWERIHRLGGGQFGAHPNRKRVIRDFRQGPLPSLNYRRHPLLTDSRGSEAGYR